MLSAGVQQTLALLDEGLRLYRRNFVGFLLLSMGWFVPVAAAGGLTFAAVPYIGPEFVVLLVLLWIVLAFPLALYLVGGISRATLMAQRGQPVHALRALAIPPLRALGMAIFSLVFYVLANTVASALIFCLVCPLYALAVGLLGGMGAGFGGQGPTAALTTAVGALMLLAFTLLYSLSLVVSGATYAALIYGLQPFTQEELRFGSAFQRGFELIGYRFGRNLLAFLLASAVFGAATLVIMLTIGLLLPLPLLLALGSDSRLAQGLSVSAWLLGLVLTLPPLPIAMTLLYQRNLQLREGSDLEARIALHVSKRVFSD